MAKTYNTFTNVSTGDVLTATNFNNVLTNIAGYRVPPSCQVRRTSDLTSYTQTAKIAFQSAAWDTESPSDPMWAAGDATKITIQTTGLYLVSFTGQLTATATMSVISPIIYVNNTNSSESYQSVVSGTSSLFNVSGTYSLADGDYVEAGIGVSGGSAYVVKGAASIGAGQTRLTVTWIGQVS